MESRTAEEQKAEQQKHIDELATIAIENVRREEIQNEKNLAKKMLLSVMSIDPYASIAGGAPRDWERGNMCNDIDIFFESAATNRYDMMSQLYRALFNNLDSVARTMQAKMLGWQKENIYELTIKVHSMLGEIIDISNESQYDNSNVRAVFECKIATSDIEKKVQFICVKDGHKIFDFFDCSMNCIKMGISEWQSNNDHWFTYSSTLHDAGKATNTIVFTEETYTKGLNENKAFQRFVVSNKEFDGPKMNVGNKMDIITRLINTQTNLPKVQSDHGERRHEYYTNLPF
jgi:hypothetical protein